MNDERQCQRRTIDDGGCRLVAISHLDDSDDLKMIKVDRQTDDNFTGNRKCSLKSPDLDFPGEKNLNQNKKICDFYSNIWVFSQNWENSDICISRKNYNTFSYSN